MPKNYTLTQRELVNIVFLDIINSYKGWRHLKGLPVKNQRTWSNGWTSYKYNLKLRNFKFNSLKQLYSNLNNSNINTIYLAEHVNLLWKLQWETEWNEAKKKRLIYLNKNKTALKVDLNLMANLVVSQNSKKLEKKKKKTFFKKNVFTLGFEPGFTKTLLKTSLTSSSSKSSKYQISFDNDKIIKKPKDKKTKTITIDSKKKKKSKAWD